MNKLLAVGTLVAGLTLGCSSSSGGGGGSSSGGSSGSSSGSTGDSGSDSQYDTLKGTFVAPGINVTFTGAIRGNLTNPNQTAWNAASDFANVNGFDPPSAVGTGIPAGDTSQVVVNLTDVPTAPAAGTYTCNSNGAYAIVMNFMVNPPDGGTAVINYATGMTTDPCTFTVETPMEVGADGTNLYFAHGSLTATLSPVNGSGQGMTGMLSATW
jgi:hypothetical protein